MDQSENVFLFDFETYNAQEIAEAYPSSLYDVNRLGDRWNRVLTPEEIQTERKDAIVFNRSCGNLVMNMLKCISEIYEEDERTYIDREGDEIGSV